MKRFVVLLAFFALVSVGVGQKGIIKVPEIVIKGEYKPSFKDIPGISIGVSAALETKEIPKEELRTLGEEVAGEVKRVEVSPKSPGCAYRHSVTSFFATAFKGAEGYYKRGLHLYLSKRYQDALKNFDKIITDETYKNTSFFPLALYWKGECYLKLGLKNKALKEFSKVCNNFPGTKFHDYACYSSGWLFVSRGKLKDAVSYFEKASSESSRVRDTSLLLLSYIYFRTALFDRAKDAASRVEENSPYFYKALFIKASSEMKMGLLVEAEKDFSRIIGNFSDEKLIPYALVNRGFVRVSLEKLDDALSDFLTACRTLKKDAKSVAELGLLEVYSKKGEFSKAEVLLKTLEKTKYRDEAIRALSFELDKAGHTEKAYELAKSIGKPRASDLLFLGNLAFKLSLFEEASFYYREALKSGAPQNLCLFNLGVSLYKEGKKEEAFETFLKTGGSYRDMALLWAVKICVEEGKFSEALALKKSIANPSLRIKAISLIGEGLVEKSMWMEAKKVLEEEVGSDISSYPSYLYAECLYNLGDYDGAFKILREILERPKDVKEKRICRLLLVSLLAAGKDAELLKYTDFCSPYLKGEAYYFKAEAFYRKGDYEKSAFLYRKALDAGISYPEKLEAYLKLSNALSNLGKGAEALASLLKAESEIKRERPSLLPRIWYALIELYYKQGRYEYFQQRARAFIERYPQGELSKAVRVMLGDYLLTKGLADEAERVYKPILESNDPVRFNIFLNLGWFYLRKGEAEKAFKYFKRAADSGEPGVREGALLGAVRSVFMLKEWDRCIELAKDFESSFTSSHSLSFVKYLMALAFAEKGRVDEAVSILKEISSSPSSSKEIVVKSLKKLVELDPKNALVYLDILIPMLHGREKAEFHLKKCILSHDPNECVKISYLYNFKDIVSKAFTEAARIYYKRGDLPSLEKVRKRAKKVLGTTRDIDQFVEKLKGGRR